MKRLLWFLLLSTAAGAAPLRVLYMTHSAGFVMTAFRLRALCCGIWGGSQGEYEVLYFFASSEFTSSELELSDQQKADLLAFVLDAKGFGGGPIRPLG